MNSSDLPLVQYLLGGQYTTEPAVCYLWEGVQSFYIEPIQVLHFNYENFSATALDIIYDFSMIIIIPF